jgi:hypothetical protein
MILYLFSNEILEGANKIERLYIMSSNQGSPSIQKSLHGVNEKFVELGELVSETHSLTKGLVKNNDILNNSVKRINKRLLILESIVNGIHSSHVRSRSTSRRGGKKVQDEINGGNPISYLVHRQTLDERMININKIDLINTSYCIV